MWSTSQVKAAINEHPQARGSADEWFCLAVEKKLLQCDSACVQVRQMQVEAKDTRDGGPWKVVPNATTHQLGFERIGRHTAPERALVRFALKLTKTEANRYAAFALDADEDQPEEKWERWFESKYRSERKGLKLGIGSEVTDEDDV